MGPCVPKLVFTYFHYRSNLFSMWIRFCSCWCQYIYFYLLFWYVLCIYVILGCTLGMTSSYFFLFFYFSIFSWHFWSLKLHFLKIKIALKATKIGHKTTKIAYLYVVQHQVRELARPYNMFHFVPYSIRFHMRCGPCSWFLLIYLKNAKL